MSTIVSVLCPSFNHEKYVKYFLDSMLAQKNKNWELVIVDDNSTDNNVKEIKKYHDKRIKLIQNKFNMGINSSLNKAAEYAHGKYFCFCASDDMLLPDYIDNIINCFKSNPTKGIVYCDLQQIDENNNVIQGDLLRNPDVSKNEILKRMFLCGNMMLSPGMAVKKDLFKKILPQPIAMSQYQDYKIHIDLLLMADFTICKKISVLYRKPSKSSGISVFNDKTIRARKMEENILMDSFLRIDDIDLLKNIFGEDLNCFGKIDKRMIPYVLGNLAMKSDVEYKQVWGYNKIADFINNIDNYNFINKKYGFCYKNFLDLYAKFKKTESEIKYKKYKKLFNNGLILFVLFVFISLIFMI